MRHVMNRATRQASASGWGLPRGRTRYAAVFAKRRGASPLMGRAGGRTYFRV